MFRALRGRRKALLLAVLLPALASCAGGARKKKGPPAASLPTWLGEVVLVDEEFRFALLDTGGARIPPDTLLVSYSGQQPSAKLMASRDARPPYLVADVASGMPHKGDRIALNEERPPRAVPAATPAP